MTGTAGTNGRPRGARARDWAEVQEGQFAAAYHAVLDRMGVRSGTQHLDAGCGAGMAAALSAERGAAVAGVLRPVESFDVDCPWSHPDEATALRGVSAAGVAGRAIAHVGEAAFAAAIRAAFAPFRRPDGGYRIGAACRCLVAAP